MTRVVNIAQSGGNNVTMRNRIINGAMMIDQRNAGASVTNNAAVLVYPVDRFAIYGSVSSKFTGQQNAGSVTPPVGFVNYLGITSSSAYVVPAGEINNVLHHIEGFNTADLGWGTAISATITLSFWVRSSLTGTFGGALRNSAGNRSYPFTYTISAANTWEQKSVTIAGDQSGTWLATNGIGISVFFGLGNGSTYSGTAGSWSGNNYYGATGATSVVGTNGATFYITGVQLEAGTTATPFEQRLYGTELDLCQRYYQVQKPICGVGVAGGTAIARVKAPLKVTMREAPALVRIGAPPLYNGAVATTLTSIGTNYSSVDCIEFDGVMAASMTTGTVASFYNNYDGTGVSASSEL